MKGTIRFGQKSKLSPRYVGPFQIKSWIKDVAYRVNLPPEFSRLHDVFHVSMLRKYVRDPSHVIRYDDVQIRSDATYIECNVTSYPLTFANAIFPYKYFRISAA